MSTRPGGYGPADDDNLPVPKNDADQVVDVVHAEMADSLVFYHPDRIEDRPDEWIYTERPLDLQSCR